MIVFLQAEGGGGGLNTVLQIAQIFLGSFLGNNPDYGAAITATYWGAWYNRDLLGNALVDSIKSVLHTLGQAIGVIVSGLGHIVNDILHGRLLQVLKDIQAMLKALGQIIAPLVAWLKELQRIQRQLQMQYLRQFIDMIQRARRILAIFRLLHLHFADKLDLYLAKLEGDVGAKWAKLLQHVNAIQSVLDQVIDPTLLLRPGNMLGSVGLMIGAVSAAVKGLSPSQLLCLPGPTTAQPFTEPWAATEARISTEMTTHTGTYAIYERNRDATLQQLAIDLGTAPLV